MKQIAFLTDIHLHEHLPVDNDVNPKKNLEIVLDDLSRRNITKIIFGGDIGDATAHPIFFEALKPYSFNLILGNHDHFNQVAGYYRPDKEKAELYYRFEEDDYKYLVLDSSTDEVSEAQLTWLRIELETSKKLLLFIHHPVLAIDTPIDKLYPLKNREQLKSVLIESEKDITIFCGHYHMNDETSYRNIKQIITQALSYQIVKNATDLKVDGSIFGYRIIGIDKDRIDTELINFESSNTHV